MANFNIIVKRNSNTTCSNAAVYVWVYDSNGGFLSRITGTTNSSGIYTVNGSSLPANASKYYVHAYYNTNGSIYEYINYSSFITLDYTDKQITVTSTQGYYYSLSKYSNYDTLLYYIGELVDVFPYKLEVKNETGGSLGMYTVTSTISSPTITGYCSTQYLVLTISPYGNADLYDNASYKFDIFGYLGGNISNYETCVPRKIYYIENPVVYDTVEIGNDIIIDYNLPNTNVHIHFYGWPDYYYNNYFSSNDSAITIVNEDIQTSNGNNDWFYRCLACKNINYTSLVYYDLSKNHYNDTSRIFVVSALTVSSSAHFVPYSISSDTINYLYVTTTENPNNVDGNGNIIPDSNRKKCNVIKRELDAVFTRQELEDYVRGFGYTYNGSWGQSNEGRSISFDRFDLNPNEKAPPSKFRFYTEATNALPGATLASTLTEFKNNFIDVLECNGITTVYELPEYTNHYSEDNNHCYVMEESIIPSAATQPDYFYFYNNNSIPTHNNATAYTNEQLSNMNTCVGIRLDKIGNPDNIELQYSYNGGPFTDYTIGEEIILLKGNILSFKAKSVNSTFSKNATNYYKFVVNNNYQSTFNGSPTYDELIRQYCNLNYGFYNANKVGYDVLTGGKISSLLNISKINGWENSVLNSYGFFGLFQNCWITNCKDDINNNFLKLDLINVPSYGYEAMFYGTVLLKQGPKIFATSIGEYSMYGMFFGSYLSSLYDNTLYFTSPASHCCYMMFMQSNYNTKLKIKASNGYVSSAFEQMFKEGRGENAQVQFENMTVFGTSACTQMFFDSKTTKFAEFSNDISDIGTMAFYEMYRYSNITNVTFTVTGSVQYEGCMYMCSGLKSNSCSINNMHLDSNNLSILCYAYMFYDSKCAHGLFSFDVPATIPVSGCCNMFQNTGNITCNILPALKLNNYCYAWMFCNSDIEIAPELPSIGLYEECYRSMFQNSKITHHYNHKIHNFNPESPSEFDKHTLDFGVGSEDIIEDGYVLNATILPIRCYSYMYAWSKLQYVSNIITSDLSEAQEESCFHMFDSTPIFVCNRERWLYNKQRDIRLTYKEHGNESLLATTSMNSGDWFVKPYYDYTFNGTNGDILVLTAMTIGGYNGDDYVVKSTPDECSVVGRDGYCGVSNGYYYFELLINDNPRQFETKYYKNTVTHDYYNATDDRQHTATIGTYPTYSYDESNAINDDYKSIYSFNHKSEYVYLNATTVGVRAYAYMFYNCYNLIPGHNFKFSDSNNLITCDLQSFSYMFGSCKRIRTITKDINNIIPGPYCFEGMYSNCYENIKDYWTWQGINIFNLFQDLFNLTYSYIGLDYICSNVGTKYLSTDCEDLLLGKTLNSYCTNEYRTDTHYFNEYGVYANINNMSYYNFTKQPSEGSFKEMFKNCNALRYAKIGLNGSPMADFCYQEMFSQNLSLCCGVTISTALTSAPTHCCHAMFQNCVSLSGPVNDSNKLSPTILGTSCYASMYKSCSSLSAGPYLPATSMAQSCYNEMFCDATDFSMEIKIKTRIIVKRSNNTTHNYEFGYCVEGNSISAKSYYYISYPSNSDDTALYTDSSCSQLANTDFSVNNVPSDGHKWYFPNTNYFNNSYWQAVTELSNQLNTLLSQQPYVVLQGDTGRTGYITSHEEMNVGDCEQPSLTGGIKYIKANISPQDIVSQNYTYYWLSGVINKSSSEYHGPAYNISISNRNGSTIPDKWSTYSS